jgi:Protein DA1
MLVEASALNEYRAAESHSLGPARNASTSDHSGPSGHGGAGGPITHTRGLCLYEWHETIRVGTIHRDKRTNSLFSSTNLQPLTGSSNRIRDRRYHVSAILVLSGMSWLLTGAVLAHELMHAWLRMEGYRELPQAVEEGLCQLLAYLWLEGQQLEVRHVLSCDSLVASWYRARTCVCRLLAYLWLEEQQLEVHATHGTRTDPSPCTTGTESWNTEHNKFLAEGPRRGARRGVRRLHDPHRPVARLRRRLPPRARRVSERGLAGHPRPRPPLREPAGLRAGVPIRCAGRGRAHLDEQRTARRHAAMPEYTPAYPPGVLDAGAQSQRHEQARGLRAGVSVRGIRCGRAGLRAPFGNFTSR